MGLLEPYYQDEAVTIYHGDAFRVLPALKEAGVHVDVVVTDPDYNAKDIGVCSLSYEGGMPHLPEAEYASWCMEWFRAVSVLTDRIAFSPGNKHLWNYPKPRWVLAWYKPGAIAYNALGGFSIWEPILVYGEKVPRISQDAYESTPLNFATAEWTRHPCPKHPSLWRWLVNSVSRPGETVLDPFLGSGTTARVCKDLGRKCIGIERVETYCAMSARRMAQTVLPLEAL